MKRGLDVFVATLGLLIFSPLLASAYPVVSAGRHKQ